MRRRGNITHARKVFFLMNKRLKSQNLAKAFKKLTMARKKKVSPLTYIFIFEEREKKKKKMFSIFQLKRNFWSAI